MSINRIAAYRMKKNRMYQGELAKRLSYAQSYISAIESGVTIPTPEIAIKIALELDTTLEQMFPELDRDQSLYFTKRSGKILIRRNAVKFIKLEKRFIKPEWVEIGGAE